VHIAPFPHAYRYGWDEETAVNFALKELDHLLLSISSPADTAGFIIEPVQGDVG
jgi:4-aminobutyrate aminotransferase